MKTETITLAEFIAAHGITMTAKPAAMNRNMEGSDKMDNWICTLKRFHGPLIGTGANKRPTFREQMRVPFSMGKGLGGKAPEAQDVLSCLASDASLAADTFADFCANCGYDEDSRKAFRSFRQCQRQTDKLKSFLTPEQFETLLYGTEPL